MTTKENSENRKDERSPLTAKGIMGIRYEAENAISEILEQVRWTTGMCITDMDVDFVPGTFAPVVTLNLKVP